MKATRASRFFGTHRVSAGVLCAVLFLCFAHVSYGAPRQAAALPIVTEQNGTTLSDKFFAQNAIGIKANGDVFMGSGSVVLFYWEAATGTKTRLLQVNDPMPGYPGSVIKVAGAPMQVNSAGHAAMVVSWAAAGVKNPAGVFVYNGSQYQKVALAGESAPGVTGGVFTNFRDVRVNANDQVAFVAEFEPAGPDMLGVFLGSPTSAPVKIATITDLDPLMDGPVNIYLIGVDDAGNVAFLCEDYGNPAYASFYTLVVGSPTGVLSLIQTGNQAPGTVGNLSLTSNRGYYSMNADGDVAFLANVWGDPAISAGIWVRSLAGSVQKLAVIGEPTGTSLGGTYTSFIFRGFNDSGKVLYSANLAGSATTGQALFLKTLTTGAEVVCYRNQVFSGAQLIQTVAGAFLSQTGKVAVLTALMNPIGRVLLLCDPSTSPEMIALEGDATPAGGTYALIGSIRIGDANQVAFRSDITSLNANGLFFWASGSPVQSIMNTNETILAGANRALYDLGAIVSDDEALFWGYSGEGKDTIFTKSLRPGDSTIRRVIGDGDADPGGGIIAYINRPAMNDQEEIVITSSIIGGTPYPATALWLSKPGNVLQKLVTTGDQAPGSAGGAFSGFPSQPRINNQSEVAFYTNISGAGLSSSGVFLVSSSGTVQLIARLGDASPAGGTFFNINTTIYLSDIGTVAFRATSLVAPNTYVDGYFVGSATAAPVKVMAVGDSWGAGTFSSIEYAFRMNSAGQVAFWADLSYNDGGIFIASPGSAPEAIVLADDDITIPGTFIELRYPDAWLDINSSGQVAFWGVYWIDAMTETFGTGYFVGSAGTTPTPVVTTGQALPGGGTCPIFVPVAGGFALADSGEQAMYIPAITGAPDLPRYIIAAADGALRRFASVGEKAPGTDGEFGRLGSVGANSSGRFFVNAMLVEGSDCQGIFQSGSMLAANDTDRDGLTDVSVFRPASGVWYTLPSHTPGEYTATQWGTSSDMAVPGDYDGDGKGDVAVWRPETGVWYVVPSSAPTTYEAIQWGISTDIPVPGDYDGDGKDDIAAWRASTGVWYILPSSDPGSFTSTQWGLEGDIAVPFDYDGDGRKDIAVWRPGSGVWYILLSSTPGSYAATQWGQASDKPVPGDYDGDGFADIAVWRPDSGIWYILPSGTPGSYSATQWGILNDVPLGGDFDGDGKADIAVFRPSAGTWYALPSAVPGTYTAIQWGLAADVPINGLTGIIRQDP